jgi:flagellar biosynthesis repressor protein FlbT
MALKISLKPGERFVVNGAVITNGDRRAAFVIQNKASILRERDIMTEDEVTTPARRVYWPIMLSYLDAERAGSYYEEFVVKMSDLMGAIENRDIQLLCVQISLDMMKREFYRALTGCRKLIEYETAVFAAGEAANALPESREDDVAGRLSPHVAGRRISA